MKPSKLTLIEKAKTAKRESRYVEFKEMFDIDSPGDWCEIIKDIVAIANSGGGILVFGCKSDGTPTGYDFKKIINLDPAIITDKIQKYTNIQFNDFELEEIIKDKKKLAAIVIEEIRIPMVFVKPGQYVVENNKQKTAFNQGTIYYRHGAKSEHCNYEDLKEIIQRNLDQIKKSWLGNIKKVVAAPTGSKLEVLPPAIIPSQSLAATPIRITNDLNAPSYKLEDPNKTHPHRGLDVMTLLNKELKPTNKINSFHLQCIRKEYKIDESRPDFFYKPKFGSPQFSAAFVSWLSDHFKTDALFFDKLRQKYLKKR